MRFRSRLLATALNALAIAAFTGCGRGGGSYAGKDMELVLPKTGMAYITAAGRETRLFVTVNRDDSIAVGGGLGVGADHVEYRPSFPFDPGRTYYVHLTRGDSTVIREIMVPADRHVPTTKVAVITPNSDSVPENLLRMYIHFSGQMSRESGVEHIHLLDENGREVEHTFLPLDGDFWNPPHTRYTLFFDPGRVKRGILPNEQMGRPLRAGKTYTLVVDSTWRDANGQMLMATYRQKLRASAALMSPITMSAWSVTVPRAGTTDGLSIRFDRLMDAGLLDRSLTLLRNGKPVDYANPWRIGARLWGFSPRRPWEAGDYQIVALSVLEDVAGNRIDHPFEVDMFERVDSTSAPERYTLPITIRK